ncbi:MAG: DMT family transporter [Gammaproteobacteria bacterium]|nr:DMT family transporter [Gammaproteobacteria bacterium]
MTKIPLHAGVVSAMLAAALFGASVPLAKLLGGTVVSPLVLAGLLYLASGLGLLAWWLLNRARVNRSAHDAALTRRDLPWLAGAILSGGVVGPVLLMMGLMQATAASASLLLNLEGVLTALLAWFVFKENFDRRIALGMALIVAGGVVLSWPSGARWETSLGTLFIVGACLCWAIDNNLTRKIAAGDPVQIAGLKGLVAGLTNTGIAISFGATLPNVNTVLAVGVVGMLGYGMSLVLFVLALRHLGSARTGAYFSVAPFFGAALSLLLLHETPGPLFWIAAAFMGAGVWLHLTERHEHVHQHEAQSHAHRHVHDEHHQHHHDFPWNSSEPHVHLHRHDPIVHKHPHYPDIHHRHRHRH